MTCFVLAVDLGGRQAPSFSPFVLVLASISPILGLLFLLVERYWAKEPVFPLRLLMTRDALTAYLVAGFQIAAQMEVSNENRLSRLYKVICQLAERAD